MGLVHDIVDSSARRWPDNVWVSTADAAVTYFRAAHASESMAQRLRGLGVSRGDRIVVVGRSDVVVPIVVVAASRLGAIFVVLHEDTNGRALRHVLTDCEPAVVVAQSEPNRHLAAEHGSSVLDYDDVRSVIEASGRVGVPSCAPSSGPLETDPVCLIYTSGTTAAPKGVVSTHAQVTFAAAAIQSQLHYQDDDIVFCPVPLSFDYGLYQLFLAALSGSHVRLAQVAETGPSLLRTIRDSAATVLASMPMIADALARLVRRDPSQAPRLRLLTNTGAAMPPQPLAELRRVIPDLKVQLMFGLTECKRAAIAAPDDDLARPGSSGRALPGTEIVVMGPDGPLPAGEVGELVVRGPNVMAGYWRRPDETAARFRRVEGLFPELWTGDHGWLDDDGHVYVSGRRDDFYKERGFRVSAAEVESAARRVRGVQSAAVVPPEERRPAMLAVVAELPADEVLTMLRSEIEPYKVPRRCIVLPELPLTGNGKVDRAALAEAAGHA